MKKILALAVSFAAAAMLWPAADADRVSAATQAATIQLGSSGMQKGETFYLGMQDSHALPWYLVNPSNGLLAMSKYTLAETSFGGVNYEQSAAGVSNPPSALRTAVENIYTSDFTTGEKTAIAQTTLTGDSMATGCENLTTHLFPLSLGDIQLFTLGSDILKAEPLGNIEGGTAPVEPWWLRTAYTGVNDATVIIDAAGSVSGIQNTSQSTSTACGVRPAFKLDTNNILMISQINNGKISGPDDDDNINTLNAVGSYTVGTGAWKLTLLDTSRSSFAASLNAASSATVETGNTIKFDYSGAKLGRWENVSLLLVDSSGNVKEYGRIAKPDGSSTSGTQEIRIPTDLASGAYTLRVYSENWIIGKDTEYASPLRDIALTVHAPHTITVYGSKYGTAGANVLTSAVGHTIKLSAAPKSGYRFKEWQVEKGGITVGTDNTFIMPDNDVTVSAVFEQVPTYTITASPATLDFGGKNGTYTAPAAQTVTVKNTGNQTVTLTKTDPADYTVSALSATTLAPGATATFTVQPKGSLSAGSYNESVVVSTANGTSATAAVKFQVNAAALTAAVTPAAATITHGDSQTLTAAVTGGSGNYTYAWYAGSAVAPFAATASVTVTPDATTTYRLVVQDGVEEKQASAAVTVNMRTFIIGFAPNGGSGTMASDTATEGQPYTLPSCGFTPPVGKRFLCWAIGSPAGTQVKAGETHLFTEPAVLAAVWENIPTPGTGTSTGGTAAAVLQSTPATPATGDLLDVRAAASLLLASAGAAAVCAGLRAKWHGAKRRSGR